MNIRSFIEKVKPSGTYLLKIVIVSGIPNDRIQVGAGNLHNFYIIDFIDIDLFTVEGGC